MRSFKYYVFSGLNIFLQSCTTKHKVDSHNMNAGSDKTSQTALEQEQMEIRKNQYSESMYTSLHQAVYWKDIKAVKDFLKRGFDPNQQDKNGNAPLHIAASLQADQNDALRIEEGAVSMYNQGGLGIVQALLEGGADPDQQDKGGNTALHIAALQCNVDIVKVLIEKGANSNQKNCESETPFHLAASMGDVNSIQALMKGADYRAGLNIKDKYGNVPLHIAVSEGRICVDDQDIDLIQAILENGGEPNVKNINGDTPLHIAVISLCGNTARYSCIIKILLEHKADPNACSEFKYTPLHMAAFMGNSNTLQSIMNSCDCKEIICNADQSSGHIGHNIIEVNSEDAYYADVNQAIYYNEHSSHYSPLDGNDKNASFRANICIDIVQDLLNNGADPNVKSSIGMKSTPLHLATSQGCINIVRALLEKGADPNQQDKKGWIPLHVTAFRGDVDIVKVLLEKEVDFNRRNIKGNTALHMAAFRGDVDIVKVLLEKEGIKNLKNCEGNTAFHIAISQGNLDVVKLFLLKAKEHESEDLCLYDVDGAGYDPYSLGILQSSTELTTFLLDENFYPLLTELTRQTIPKDSDDMYAGHSPLHIAVLKKDANIVKLLLEVEKKVCCYIEFGLKVPHTGNTALHLATINKDLKTIEVLVDNGHCVHIKNEKGNTPLDLSYDDYLSNRVSQHMNQSMNYKTKKNKKIIKDGIVSKEIFKTIHEYRKKPSFTSDCGHSFYSQDFGSVARDTSPRFQFRRVVRANRVNITLNEQNPDPKKMCPIFKKLGLGE